MNEFDYSYFDVLSDEVDLDSLEEGDSFGKFINLDYNKLKKYIQFQLNIRNIDNGTSTNMIAEFRKCTMEDF